MHVLSLYLSEIDNYTAMLTVVLQSANACLNGRPLDSCSRGNAGVMPRTILRERVIIRSSMPKTARTRVNAKSYRPTRAICLPFNLTFNVAECCLPDVVSYMARLRTSASSSLEPATDHEPDDIDEELSRLEQPQRYQQAVLSFAECLRGLVAERSLTRLSCIWEWLVQHHAANTVSLGLLPTFGTSAELRPSHLACLCENTESSRRRRKDLIRLFSYWGCWPWQLGVQLPDNLSQGLCTKLVEFAQTGVRAPVAKHLFNDFIPANKKLAVKFVDKAVVAYGKADLQSLGLPLLIQV